MSGQESTNKDKALPIVEEILRGTEHALTIFKLNASNDLEMLLKRGTPYLRCFASGKERPAKPEEIVRQLYVKMLMDDYGIWQRFAGKWATGSTGQKPCVIKARPPLISKNF